MLANCGDCVADLDNVVFGIERVRVSIEVQERGFI